MTKYEVVDRIRKYFLENYGEYISVLEQLDEYANLLGEHRCYKMDDMMHSIAIVDDLDDPVEILKKAFWGGNEVDGVAVYTQPFNPYLTWFREDGNGNLISVEEPDYDRYLSEKIFWEYLIEYRDDLDMSDDLYDLLSRLDDTRTNACGINRNVDFINRYLYCVNTLVV